MEGNEAMNSAQLAGKAGVSVRMLRYYHKTGVLPEPPRSANGYRRYDTPDLIRVLRIKRLLALGISLKSMTGLLDRAPQDPADSLDELDRELQAEIDRLSHQRQLLARARVEHTTVDHPVAELERCAGDTWSDSGQVIDINRFALVGESH